MVTNALSRLLRFAMGVYPLGGPFWLNSPRSFLGSAESLGVAVPLIPGSWQVAGLYFPGEQT